MRAYVFTERALERQAGRFVWLSLDSEKAKNAPHVKPLGVRALPTFFVLDPDGERVLLRWVGSMSVTQLEKFLDDGRALAGRERRDRGADGLEGLVARAEALNGEGRYEEAAEVFEQALAASPPAWPRYGRTVETLVTSLSLAAKHEACARAAREALARLRGSSSGASVAGTGLASALALPDTVPGRAAMVADLEAAVRRALADRSLPLTADDRSGLYIALLDARDAARDSAGRVAEEWSAYLDGEAERAGNPERRMVYDSHRLAAYLELGRPERAVPMLEASARDAPGDYNPPARLAVAYHAMKDWEAALAASDRAMALAYGPRKLRIYDNRVAIYLGMADTTAAKRTLEEAVAHAEALPEGQRPAATIAALKKRLGGMK